MKTLSTLTAAIFISATLVGSAVAQSSIAAPSSKPATASKSTSTEKQAVSKTCSDQADAKGLHGKERKKFRNDCKRKGGKAS